MEEQLTKKQLRFWSASYFVILLMMIAGFLLATSQITYSWRWSVVPTYFVTHQDIEINSEIEGEVQSIESQGTSTVIAVRGDDGVTVNYDVPEGEILASQGDMVFIGDTLGKYQEWVPGLLLLGLIMTIKVSIYSIIIGILLGIIGGIARISVNPAARWMAYTYVELIRGTPLLVQIFIWYYIGSTLVNQLFAKYGGFEIPAFWYGVIALAIFTGAYVTEIVRSGIQSINRGQTEAARSLGMSHFQSLGYIIMPQAMRRILPPLAGQFISLIKDSSLLGIIAVRELTKATREAVTTSFASFELFFTCAALYLVLTFTLSLFVQYLERRMGSS
ncbi:MAG: ABC transporter permease subunit [Thermodesulfobacteriota bacterium]